MGTSDERAAGGGSSFRIGSVSGTGHHIGDHGVVHNTVHAADVRDRLREVLGAARADDAVELDPEVAEEAAAVEVELAGGAVDRSRIGALLARVTQAAGAASAVGAATAQLGAAVQAF